MSNIPSNSDELRKTFLDFFKKQDHLLLPSSSLIPAHDPSLLLTNSGMAQFKSYFSGEMIPPHPRIVTTQKCFRTTDIDEVGDDTHLTLFEMLGNFSFGDYFKEDACKWALDLMLNYLGFEFERLYFTVYKTDVEAEAIWLSLGIPNERIYKFGDSDNWWGPAGEDGPCGPSSEINYYTGSLKNTPKITNRDETSNWGPNNSSEFIELYNLVFTQFNRDINKKDTLLPNKNIDTGMGLERTLVILQNVNNIYQTDLFQPIIKNIENISNTSVDSNIETDKAIRVLAEHARSATFLISDGVIPENSGRGYVLRRLIRRGMMFGNELGIDNFPLSTSVPIVVQLMGNAYPELKNNESFVIDVLEKEETTFLKTLKFGASVLDGMIDYRKKFYSSNQTRSQPKKGDDPFLIGSRIAESVLTDTPKNDNNFSNLLSGKEIFLLYDTYGFPPEVTKETIKSSGFDFDISSFNIEMNKQKARGKLSNKSMTNDKNIQKIYEALKKSDTAFKGYETCELSTKIKAIIKEDKIVKQAKINDEVQIVLYETPFYAERGGQVGDTGKITGENFAVDINDTNAPIGHMSFHYGVVSKGIVHVDDDVKALVDLNRREKIKRNHTATHLLHASLREIIGPHVRQSGSLVAPDRLRFDFTNLNPLTDQELKKIESRVCEKIRANTSVEVYWTSYAKAVDEGALAFFGDTYENQVRTIKIDPPWSYELCGGTHMDSTGGIGSFIILSETGIGTGIRRIEALTGIHAEKTTKQYFSIIKNLSEMFKSSPDKLLDKIIDSNKQIISTKKKIEELENQLLEAKFSSTDNNIQLDSFMIGKEKIQIQTIKIDSTTLENLRNIADKLKSNHKNGVVIVGGDVNKKPSIIVMATNNAVNLGINSGNIAKFLSQIMQGGGGGSPYNAQGGGKNLDQLEKVLNNSLNAVKNSIRNNKSQ